MASKPQKRLGEFLNEQQEPFMLELYLIERGYSKKCLNKKRNVLLPFCKGLISLVNKLAFQNQSSTLPTTNRDYEQTKKHANCNVQFSSTMFNSCSNIDEEGTSISMSSQKNDLLFSSHIHQTSDILPRWQWQRCIEGRPPESLGNIPLHRIPNMNEEVEEMQQRTSMPKKIADESLLSVAILNLLGGSIKKEYLPESHVSQELKSKRVSQKIKKLLFDCVRDITITLPAKEVRNQVCRQSMETIELKKNTCQEPIEWGQHSEDGLKSLSIIEWGTIEPQVKDITFEITDAILDIMNNEIVSEMIETLATPFRISSLEAL